HILLEDINVDQEGNVGHQHIDFIYFAKAESDDINPATGEQCRDDWQWFTQNELQSHPNLTPEVRQLGLEAIQVVQD
ncbi:MAG: NUDIX hydrolase, partial [Halobacteriaceae archaeon]